MDTPDPGDVPPETGMVSGPAVSRRVLRVITRLNIGGPARQALLLTKELSDEFPTVLAAGRPRLEEGELSDPSVRVRYVPLVRPIRPLTDAKALREMRRLIREVDPAVVHTHMAKAGGIARTAARNRPQTRTIHTFHGHVLEGYFSSSAQRVFISLERRLARTTDVLVAVSDEIRDSLLELGIGRESQYRVIPLGLDLEPFLRLEEPSGRLRKSMGISEQAALVGIVGRITAIKGHAVLLRALTRLPDEVHLAVIGDGEERRETERLAHELGVSDRTHFVGWVPDVADAVGDLDVVVLTSHNEGTPVALIEALSAGKPVVATDVGGVRSVVTDGETGIVVPPSDSEAVADAIERLLEDDELRRRMGAAGRKDVAARFDYRHLCETIRALYREVIA